ncbi:hypothetical protein [Mucilaginibacter rubeus]|uniref:Uncharacterized protein n=1 Tax=Mucilaginibacter rubeus TaxID=2027860 RepID=A0A5C1I9R0_9SPHI|nr:hypothetical protein [Mucilaginibacter rubeus]QEM13491.1 hypothetical protein DEO27_026925 [Mucilaginibacter rubeus]
MNRYDFTQPGGFPFDQGVMKFIQDCIGTAAQTAALAGPLAILSGCDAAGTSVSDGVVVINGEILPFVGGVKQTKVIIQENATTVVFQDNQPRVVKYVRAARFGDDGTTAMLWANFKRNTTEGVLARLDRVEGLLRPFAGVGGMVWWKGTKEAIPTGWREVEGWRGRLPMHYNPDDADFATVGAPGGSKTVTMALENLIEHDHEQYVSITDQTGTLIEDNRLSGGSGRGLWAKIFGRTAKTGSANPAPMKIVNPYITGMWIEPIPGTF